MESLEMVLRKPVRAHDSDFSVEITEGYKEEAIFDVSFESWEGFNQWGKGGDWVMEKRKF